MGQRVPFVGKTVPQMGQQFPTDGKGTVTWSDNKMKLFFSATPCRGRT